MVAIKSVAHFSIPVSDTWCGKAVRHPPPPLGRGSDMLSLDNDPISPSMRQVS